MKRRILLADDSVTIQKVIELTFMDEDYEVRAVSNGDEAVALLSSLNPDFVIADVHMPGANGYEVCRRAKQNRPDLPVLLLVGTFEPFDEAQARAVGADSHLKKPFDSQELLQRVEELLAAKAPAGAAAASAAAPEAPAPQAVPDWLAAPAAPDFAAAPDLSAEPSWGQPAEPAWGNFELEPESASPFAAPAPAAPEPFDHEPSFSLEPDPGFQVEAEPVFSLETDEPSFGVREDVFGAPSELSFDETPQDRYIEEPLAEEPAASAAGFNWTPEPEPQPEQPFRFEAPAAPAWAPAVPEPLIEPQLQWSEPEPFAALEAEPFAANPEPEPAFPPGPTMAPVYEPEPAYAAQASPEAGGNGHGRLSDDDVDRIARRVVELLGDRAVRDVAWEVIPDMAEVIIRDRLRELEAQVE
jgi:CheY-like chemotaxis protein